MNRFTRPLAALALAALCLVPVTALAAALTAVRDTPVREGGTVVVGVYTNTRIWAGGMVALNSSGYAVPAADSAGLAVVGRAESTVDNRAGIAGAGDSGTLTIAVRRGVFRWANGDSFTDADIGDLAYVEDDQTVQKAASASQDIIAGAIVDVDSDGVWVDTHDIGSQGAGSVTSLSASGNATVGGTLGVTGATTLAAVTASGNASVGGTLGVTGAATLSSTLVVTGSATLSTNLTVNGTAVLMPNLPTATNGLASGTLWSDSGTLKLMP